MFFLSINISPLSIIYFTLFRELPSNLASNSLFLFSQLPVILVSLGSLMAVMVGNCPKGTSNHTVFPHHYIADKCQKPCAMGYLPETKADKYK